jgi:hypothetical protein
LRRNVEYPPDQPLPATFGIPARSSVDFDRHSNICLRVSQQSFPAAEIAADAAAAGGYTAKSRNRPTKENRAPRQI